MTFSTIRRLAAVPVALAAFVAVVALPGAAHAAGATELYTLADPRIDEASGIGVGIASPGIDYVENDSGDVNRFFALDAQNGQTAAVVTVPDAVNVDWEDLAVAPDAAGTPSVWLGDIGDNNATRKEVTVYRVDEPTVSPTDRNRSITASPPDIWRLKYPGGPVNAESLAVTPRGVAYIITKSVIGASVVYRVPAKPDPDHVQTLVRVGSIQFSAQTTGTPEGGVGTLTATSASVSRNGDLLAVRTYSDAYVWPLHGFGGFGAALNRKPTHIALPVQPQGEGVSFHGASLLIDSETVHSAVYRVPLPAGVAGAAGASSSAKRGAPAQRDGRATTGGREAVQLVSNNSLAGPRTGMIVTAASAAVLLCVVLGFTGVALVRRRRTDPLT
jgi:hypothetical protein